ERSEGSPRGLRSFAVCAALDDGLPRTQRPDRLAQKDLRFTGDDKVFELADELISQPLVERAGARIERGCTDEHVRRLAEDSLFCEANQARAQSRPAHGSMDA